MGDAYIVGAVRTPTGRRGGSLSGIHPIDLGAFILGELVERIDADPAAIEDAIFGCVDQVGEQAANIGRNCVLAAGFPESVPATTVDRQCGSSQQAFHFAAQAVISGVHDVVIAAGVESMSRVPIGASTKAGPKSDTGLPYSPEMKVRYPGVRWSQFEGAEMIAQKWGLNRSDLDAFGLRSHERAARATEEGRFEREIAPIEVEIDGRIELFGRDEGIRHDASAEAMARLDGLSDANLLTAGTSSQISDGTAAILLANDTGLERLGVKPRARVHSMALAGDDPVMMLSAPMPATRTALDKGDLKIDDIDLYEVNEAFASVPLAWVRDLGADEDKLNVNGGAIALGHPLGATGVKLMTTLLHQLEHSGGRFGLQTMCEGGGLANATIIEAL